MFGVSAEARLTMPTNAAPSAAMHGTQREMRGLDEITSFSGRGDGVAARADTGHVGPQTCVPQQLPHHRRFVTSFCLGILLCRVLVGGKNARALCLHPARGRR